jgi:hypothetical protein
MKDFYISVKIDSAGKMVPYYMDTIPVKSSEEILAVPYHSQWETDAQRWKSDCGPATVEMVGEFYRGPQKISTDDIMQWITGGSNRNTSATNLVDAAAHFYNVKLDKVYKSDWDFLKSEISKGYPVIVLVHYGAFSMRLDRGFTGGHWMVVNGFDIIDYQGTEIERIILHDSNWWGEYTAQGADIPVIKKQFTNMWGLCHLDNNPDNMALISRP